MIFYNFCYWLFSQGSLVLIILFGINSCIQLCHRLFYAGALTADVSSITFAMFGHWWNRKQKVPSYQNMNMSQAWYQANHCQNKNRSRHFKKENNSFHIKIYIFFHFYLDDDFFYKVRILNLKFRQESFCLTDLLILTKSSSIDFLLVSSDLEFS